VKHVHLSDKQLTEVLTGVASAELTTHLAECETCRKEVDDMNTALKGYAVAVQPHPADPHFWLRQRNTIMAAVAQPHRRPGPLRWAWAPAALIICAALLLAGNPDHPQEGPARTAQPQAVIDDEALLMEIQSDLQTGMPDALVPAALIANERSRLIRARSDNTVRNQ